VKIKCVKQIYEIDHKQGLMQIFLTKDGSITSARIRQYKCTVAGKPKFSYCSQSISYAQSELTKKGQKPLIESVASKAIEIGETCSPDQNGQANGQKENCSNSKNKCGCSLAWFRTSACHVDDPGSNPGNRTKIQVRIQRDPNSNEKIFSANQV
jgi:hypothetical protein